MAVKIIVSIIAAVGAGFGTGLAGMSAAAVISPMLVAFLDMDPYMAVGIALASDVLASALSAYTYKKNDNLDVKNGLVMMFSCLAFTFIGSMIASHLPSMAMGSMSMIMTVFLGLKFIVKPVMHASEKHLNRTKKQAIVLSIVCGSVIGMICGIVGAGGGMMMLLILVSVLGYEIKTAVGTSVFIMTFTALTGSISHFAIAKTMPDILVLVICVVVTAVSALLTSKFANKASEKTMNRVLGVGLMVLGISMIIVKFIVK